MAVVATNIQRIITGIQNLTAKASSKKGPMSRRKNSTGQPLRRPYEHEHTTAAADDKSPGRRS